MAIDESQNAKALEAQQDAEPETSDAPPPYTVEAAEASRSRPIPQVTPPLSSSISRPISRSKSRGAILNPIAIPQTTKLDRPGSTNFVSPFARAYAPSLANLLMPLSQSEFLTFIDGLNSSFIASAPLQVTEMIGKGATKIPLLFPIRWIGAAVQAASGYSSGAISYSRAKKYMKQANLMMFAPRGLRATLMKTTEMMQAVEYHDVKGTGRLNLPPLDEMTGQDAEAVVTAGEVNADFGTEVWADDPRIRRLRALDGYVEQLRFDVPPAQPPTEFWKKFGAKTTKRAEEKHMRVMLNNRDMSRKEGKRAQLDESEAKVAGKILWLVIENLDDNRRPSSSHSSFSSEPPSSITDPVPAGLSAASSEPSQRSHTKS